MPKATTRADKMAMKGEPINLQNFKRNFDEEIEAVKQNFTKAHKGFGPIASLLRNVFDLLERVFGVFLKVAVKAVGALIILVGTLALFATIVGMLSLLGFWNSSAIDQFPFTAINPQYKTAIYFSAFALLLIPIIALVLFAVRVVFNHKIMSRTSSFVLLVLWLTGLITGIYYGSRLAAEFIEEAAFEQIIALKPFATYRIELNKTVLFSKDDSLEFDLNQYSDRKMTIHERGREMDMPRNLSIHIEKSEGVSQPTLVQVFSARGANFKSALKYAQHIDYRFSQTDSILKFDWMPRLPKNELWRDQAVR